jgi:hypothetical protein
MTVILQSGYTVSGSDEPLTHARIAHAENWKKGGTVSASTTDSDYFEDAPNNTLTYEKWKPTAAPATWEYNHTSSRNIDYCAIAAHTLGSSGATIKAQYYSGSSWVNLCDPTAIDDDSPIFIIFDTVNAERYRLRIDSYSSAPEIGVIKFGVALQMQRPLFGGHKPIEWARNVVLRTNSSETGEFLGRSKQRTFRETTYDWSHLSTPWVKANWGEMQRAVETEPFWIAWRPSNYEGVAFGVTDQSPQPTNMGVQDLMQVSLNVRARGYD